MHLEACLHFIQYQVEEKKRQKDKKGQTFEDNFSGS